MALGSMEVAHFDSSIAAADKDKASDLHLVDYTIIKVGDRLPISPNVAPNGAIDFNKERLDEIDGKKWLHDPTELAKLMSDSFRHTGKLEFEDAYMMKEAMRANYKDLEGWASKFNEALRGSGTSIKMGDRAPTVGQGGVMDIYTAHIMHGGKETDSTYVSF
jgi:hypothetical protein